MPTPSHHAQPISPFASLLSIVLIAATLRSPLTGVGALLGHIRATTGLSAASAGLLNTLPLLAFGSGALAAPFFGRRWGLERTLFCSTLLLSVGIALRSLPGTYALFGGTVLVGIAIAIGNVLLPAFIKREYPHRSGQMTGVFVTTMALTAGIAAGIAVPLADVLPGDWRASLACVLIISLPAAYVWFGNARDAGSATAGVSNTAVPHANVWGSLLAWQVTLLNGIQAASFYALVAWMPSMLFELLGVSPAGGGWMLTLLQMTSLAGCMATSSLLSRFHDQRLLGLTTSLLCVIGFAGLALYPSWAIAWVSFIGFGLGSSLMLALAFISLRSSSHSQAASLSAMSQSAGYFIAAAGPLVCGILREYLSSWVPILGGLAALSMVQAWTAYGAGRRIHIGERSA